MKKIVLKLTLLILLMIFGVTVISCGSDEEGENNTPVAVEDKYEIHTELQSKYLAGDYDLVSLYANGSEELSKPMPITVKWNLATNEEYTFYLSEEETFNSCRTFKVNTNQIDLINLKINTTYYWYVEYGDEQKSEVKHFEIVTKGPRNLDIDGVTNVRDLGGYQTSYGKVSKQGLIYRSARLNENASTKLLITEKGIKEMVEVLGVKTELDVRQTSDNENGGITSSPLGDSVNYVSVPMVSGGNLLLLNNDIIKDVFSVFGKEENYPIVIHCSIGTDRTGAICFLINALLGVDEEVLYRDYLFSNFGNITRGRTSSIIKDYLKILNRNSGSNLSEKTENYLLSIGVKDTDINTIKKVMLG